MQPLCTSMLIWSIAITIVCWLDSVIWVWAFLLSNQAPWETQSIEYKVVFSWHPLWKDGCGRQNKRSMAPHTPCSLWSRYLVIISLTLAEGELDTEDDKPSSEMCYMPRTCKAFSLSEDRESLQNRCYSRTTAELHHNTRCFHLVVQWVETGWTQV